MPYKDLKQRKEFNKRYWKENKEHLSEKALEWKIDNKEKHKLSRKRYTEENRDLINTKARIKYNKNRLVKSKKLIRCKTLQKYGRLKNGYIYHHNTNPYDADKFDILEGDIHDYLEKHMNRMIKNKKTTGLYNL